MARRISKALLLALLLLAVQTAILTHAHGDDAPPAGTAAQGCEFCAGHHSAAPAPDAAVAARTDFQPALLKALSGAFLPARRSAAAHRTRAPPAFRSA